MPDDTRQQAADALSRAEGLIETVRISILSQAPPPAEALAASLDAALAELVQARALGRRLFPPAPET